MNMRMTMITCMTMIMKMMRESSAKTTMKWYCCVMEKVVSEPLITMRLACSVYTNATVSNDKCILCSWKFPRGKILMIAYFPTFFAYNFLRYKLFHH